MEELVGNLFVGLMFVEFIEKDQFVFGVTDDGDEFSGLWVYKSSTRVVTGIIGGYENDCFRGERVYDCSNGIKIGEWAFRDPLKIVHSNGSVLLWNGNLPFAYTQKPENVCLHGEWLASNGLLREILESHRDSFDSVGIIVGDVAVKRMFGLEDLDMGQFLDHFVGRGNDRINNMPRMFFERGIFEGYPVEKPFGYDMTLEEKALIIDARNLLKHRGEL